MATSLAKLSLVALVACVAPRPALAIVEHDTGTEYPDEISLDVGDEEVPLVVTGVGLREKTFLKVDVYTIVSYVAKGTELGDDKGAALVQADVPKELRMDLRRSFSRKKLVNSFEEVIDKNYEDTSAFAADLATFLGYFTRDARDKDVLIFKYVPGVGLTTTLNGEDKGVIANFAFTQALWTVWFGEKPASDGLKKELLSAT